MPNLVEYFIYKSYMFCIPIYTYTTIYNNISFIYVLQFIIFHTKRALVAQSMAYENGFVCICTASVHAWTRLRLYMIIVNCILIYVLLDFQSYNN